MIVTECWLSQGRTPMQPQSQPNQLVLHMEHTLCTIQTCNWVRMRSAANTMLTRRVASSGAQISCRTVQPRACAVMQTASNRHAGVAVLSRKVQL